MSAHRSNWIAARARNATRRGWWIAVTGLVAAIVSLLVLVLVPREVDRQLRRRIATLPVPPDTVLLARQLDTLRAAMNTTPADSVPASVVTSTVAPAGVSAPGVSAPAPGPGTSTPTATATSTSNATTTSTSNASSEAIAEDSLAGLVLRVERARQVPLSESYRAIAESPVLHGDREVAALRDSIDEVDRERERYAALGGADARYAALTTRVSELGVRLVRLAERRLADRAFPTTAAIDRVLLASEAHRLDSIARDATARRLALTDSFLLVARGAWARRDTERLALESRLHGASPPLAMVAAALVVGLVVGFGAAFARELRWPTVGDPFEVERLTGAPVLLYERGGSSTLREPRRVRERPGVPEIIDRDSDTFALLHLALTGVGDTVAHVDVLSDTAVVGAAVALGTAAAAARESRAVLVVEAPRRQPALGVLLNPRVRSTTGDVKAGLVDVEEAVHVITLDRDARIDLLIAAAAPAERRRLFARRRATTVPAVRPRRRGAESRDADGTTGLPLDETLRRLEARYDLRLQLQGGDADGWPIAADVIVCARQGATSLAWLDSIMRQTRRDGQRVRAVVLWSRDIPRD